METHTIDLPGRRRLGYCRLGSAGGAPVMSFHGGLSCRLESVFADDLCSRLGVNLIAPDRPGIGLSDCSPGRTLLDWPSDVEALADALGFDRFAVMGWSAGGPFALACAHRIGDRLTAVASVAGVAPLDWPGCITGLGLGVDRFLFRLARRHAGVAGRLLAPARWSPSGVIRRLLVHALRASGDADAEFIAASSVGEFADSMLESLRPGGLGTAHDYHLLGGDWGFSPADIETEVFIWHGLDDGLVPSSHARRLADALPSPRLNLVPEHGHFLPRRCMRDLLLALLGRPRDRSIGDG